MPTITVFWYKVSLKTPKNRQVIAFLFFFLNCVCLLPVVLVCCFSIMGHGMGWHTFPRKGRWGECIYNFECIATENYSEIVSKVELQILEAHCNTLSGQSTKLLGRWTAKWTLWTPGRIRGSSFFWPGLLGKTPKLMQVHQVSPSLKPLEKEVLELLPVPVDSLRVCLMVRCGVELFLVASATSWGVGRKGYIC